MNATRKRVKRVPKAPSRGEEAFALQLKVSAALQPWLHGWEREYPVAENLGRGWRFDFAWPELRLAVEVESPVHRIAERFDADYAKYNAAALAGWTVLRFPVRHFLDGFAVRVVSAALMPSDMRAGNVALRVVCEHADRPQRRRRARRAP